MSTATQIAAPSTELYITAAECMRRHPGLHRVKLYHAAMIGQIRVKLDPRRTPRYCENDVAQLMREQGA